MYKKQRLKRSYNHLIITKKREPQKRAGEHLSRLRGRRADQIRSARPWAPSSRAEKGQARILIPSACQPPGGGQVGMDGQEHAYHLQQAESGHSSLGRYNGRGHELVLLPSAGVITSRQSLLLLPDFFLRSTLGLHRRGQAPGLLSA
jgi:hypothetical protein